MPIARHTHSEMVLKAQLLGMFSWLTKDLGGKYVEDNWSLSVLNEKGGREGGREEEGRESVLGDISQQRHPRDTMQSTPDSWKWTSLPNSVCIIPCREGLESLPGSTSSAPSYDCFCSFCVSLLCPKGLLKGHVSPVCDGLEMGASWSCLCYANRVLSNLLYDGAMNATMKEGLWECISTPVLSCHRGHAHFPSWGFHNQAITLDARKQGLICWPLWF